jgi:hypothetical protein
MRGGAWFAFRLPVERHVRLRSIRIVEVGKAKS